MSAPNLRSQGVVSHQGEVVSVLDESLMAQSADEWRHNSSHRHHESRHVRIHAKKLYGRSTEVLTLLQAYRRMTDERENPRPEVVVISGFDGVGKTSLALTLRKRVTEDGGYFVRGKFDRLSARGEPYTAFLAAFKEFTSLVMSRGAEAVSAMRDAIYAAVPEDSRILVEMIPSLENIIGSGHEKVRLPGSLARMRFAFVFRKFVSAVCSQERPLVILLDDIHYADQSSLDLLSSLIPEASSQGILFVVSCKDPQPDSALSKLLCRLEDADTLTTRIRLLNLHNETVNSIVADILDLPAPQTKQLSDFIYQETGGNANFVLEFLGSLQEKKLLRFDDNDMRWIVSEEGIYQEMESYNVGGLIVERIMQQSQSLLEVLKVAACIGSTGKKLVLDRVFGTCVSRHLFLASECGFLVYDTQLEEYSFVHDAVQNASYSLIPKEEKRFFHLSVGRKLRRNFSTDEFWKNCFIVMNQFRLGADHIESEREKYAVAELCLQTAEKAVSASSFPTASLYLELGIWLLGEDSWKNHYALSLALFNTAAEVNYCTADFEREKALLTSVFENGRCFRDKLRAYESNVYMLGATDRMEEAMKTGLEVLEKLGESIPPYPKARRVKREIRRLKNATDSLTNEALLRLPLMKDPDKLAALKMMNLIFLYAHLCRPQLAGFLVVRMTRLTLDGGLCALSSSSFVLYGMILCSSATDAGEGYRFGRLALTLLEKFKGLGLAWLPRVYAGLYGCISPFTRPFRESEEPLKQSVMIGLEFGDIEYSLLNASLYSFNLIDAGRSLTFIEREL